MQHDQTEQDIFAYTLVVVGSHADRSAGYKFRQWAGSGNFVVTEDTGADLGQQKCQHRKHRTSAKGGVADGVFGPRLAPEITHDRDRAIDKCGKPRPPSADEPPNQSEQQQACNAITEAEVPRHRVSADLAASHRPGNRHHQRPMKNARRQVPDPDCFRHCVLHGRWRRRCT